ncbi:hypothetical protein ACHAPX_005655 [Trichoderma viride]
MEVDSENDLLSKTAAGELVESEAWPALRDEILSRVDKIARDEFPIPKLPPPLPHPRLLDTRALSPLSSSPAEQSFEDANKENENAPAGEQPPSTDETDPVAASQPPPPPAPAPSSPQSPSRSQEQSDDVLPKQLADMVGEIKSHIGSFKSYPPHTIQRIAELVLYPRAHYKALASYLHALDRVSAVTSAMNTYPLPPPIPDMSAIQLNGDEPNDPAMAVSWSNPTSVAVGSDEALGGALLTPIPWLTRGTPPPETAIEEAPVSAQIHSESTETIEGPNGVGSIETVSVSINGVPSMGASRGVTQGELLRQEQRAGIVPVTQLTKPNDMMGEGGQSEASEDQPMGDDDDEEAPHARGPDEIGVGDTGLQSETTSLMGEDGVEMEGIDLEAAVGRKHADEKSESSATEEEKSTADEPTAASERAKSPSAESVSSKREAEDDLEDDVVAKKVKEDPSGDGDTQMTLSSEKEPDSVEQKDEGESKEDEAKDESTD